MSTGDCGECDDLHATTGGTAGARGRAHVTLIDGAPGAGKTYTLHQKLESERDERGVMLGDFWWLNFSNAGRYDVIPEIEDLYSAEMTGTGGEDGDNIDPRGRAKTFHGLTLTLARREGLIEGGVGDDQEQLITEGSTIAVGSDPDDDHREVDPFADFCDRQGMTYDPDHADPTNVLSGGGEATPTGNKLFRINNYLTQTCKSPDQWWHADIDIGIASSDRVASLIQKWDQYKRNPPIDGIDYRLFEHGDYIAAAHEWDLTPDVDVLLIDEFQDLAPVEYRLYKQWRDSGLIDRIYIAGDSEQSLYSFRGGSPMYFNQTLHDEQIVLKDSHRCRDRIATVGHALLDVHPDTDPRGFSGVEDGGVVEWSGVANPNDLRDELVRVCGEHRDSDDTPPALILTRTNYQLHQLTRDLRDVGIPFELIGGDSSVWEGGLRQILDFLHTLADDEDERPDFNASAVTAVLNALPDGYDRPGVTGHVGDTTPRTRITGGCTARVNVDLDGDTTADPERLRYAFDPEPVEIDKVGEGLKNVENQWLLTFDDTEPTDVQYADDRIEVVDTKRLKPVFGESDQAVADLLDTLALSDWKHDILKNAFDAPADMGVGEVRVGTIHSSKGLQAHSVYLCTTTSTKTLERYESDPDAAAEEHRVYYVGATRAMDELHFLDDYFGGETAPPMDQLRGRFGGDN